MDTETQGLSPAQPAGNSGTINRVTHENPPPRIWRIPTNLRRRLSGRVGRQRAISEEQHLIIVLHRVPDRTQPRQPGVYFWRSPENEWFHSEQGSGFAALEKLVQEYEDRVVELEEMHDGANSNEKYFEILDAIGPIVRSARSLHETLLHARDDSQPKQRGALQPLCDQSSEIEHAAELLQSDVRNSIQYTMARQAERQAGFVREQSQAAHRLNILAALFLPMATLSSLFGMNLRHGLEGLPPLLFWLIITLGIVLGAVIGIFVMRVKGLDPNEW